MISFGLSFLPDCSPQQQNARDYFKAALRLCEIADRAGLATIKMTEHYLNQYGGLCPSPLAFLSAVAARTTRIRLMTGGILASFHHPIKIASETAMVDVISSGRLDVGFARAYMPYEFEAMGIAMEDSRERFAETLAAVCRLWVDDKVSWESRFFTFQNASILPKPIQQPHPSVWVAAVRSRQSFAWIAEQGFYLLVTAAFGPLEELRELISVYKECYFPRQSAQPRVAISLPLFIAPALLDAEREASPYLSQYFETWANAADSWNNKSAADYPGYTGLSRVIRGVDLRSLIRNGNVVVGDTSRVRDTIMSISETLGVEEFLWQIDFGCMPDHLSRRTLNLLCDTVLPSFNNRSNTPTRGDIGDVTKTN